MASKEVLKELEAYRRLCTHLDYDNDDYMLNGEYEEDNEVIETALKEYELMKQTKIITVNKDISNDDLEKIVHQRMFVDNSKQCGIKPLFDEELMKANEKLKKDLELLEQLEDLEEELGIDLVTLFKALQNGVWYKDYKDNDKIKFTDDIEENMKCKELIVPAKYTIIGLEFRDYGKTFALTREELENE